MFTALGLGLIVLLAIPSTLALGAILTAFGGCIVSASSPAWWRLLVGFGALMVAGLVLQVFGDPNEATFLQRLGL